MKLLRSIINGVLSKQSLIRFRWQVLNGLYEAGTISKRDMLNTMRTFIDERKLDEIIGGFVKKGWLVKRGDGDAVGLMLTEAGKAERETIFKRRSDVRRWVMQGIADQEYTAVLMYSSVV